MTKVVTGRLRVNHKAINECYGKPKYHKEQNMEFRRNHLCYFCLVLLCFRARLFIDALWSPAGKGLTFVMSNCEVVTFPLVSLVRCHA